MVMKKRFVYFYFMKNDPEKIKQVIPSHIEYWKNSKVEQYLGGPFSDRTGGMISFESTNLEEATEIIMNDPFIKENTLEEKWIKEWIVE